MAGLMKEGREDRRGGEKNLISRAKNKVRCTGGERNGSEERRRGKSKERVAS